MYVHVLTILGEKIPPHISYYFIAAPWYLPLYCHALQGDNVNSSASSIDYVIDVGQGQCRNIEVYADAINCVPPQPGPDPLDGDDHPAVVVSQLYTQCYYSPLTRCIWKQNLNI